MSFDIIIQARFGSSRLPGKILCKFGKKTFLDYLIINLKKIEYINNIIIASPTGKKNLIFESIAKKNQVKFFSSKSIREEDLISRYYFCAKKFKSHNIIRITSDCPFINPFIIEKMILFYSKNKLEFLTNNKPRYVPIGFDCEIMSAKILKKIYKNAKSKFEKEHVTPWFRKNCFKKINNYKIFKTKYLKIRLTLDYLSDLKFFYNNINILKKISKEKNVEYYLKKITNKYD